MTRARFEELEKRNGNDKMKLWFELHSEMFKPLPYNQFIQHFEMWLTMFAGKI